MISEIRIVGFGCHRCADLHQRVTQVVQSLGLETTVVRDNDMLSPMRYGLLGLPGLLIDGKVVSAGRVLSVEELTRLLKHGQPIPPR